MSILKHIGEVLVKLVELARHLGTEFMKLTRTHAFFHFLFLVWQSFVRNRCLVRASSLAYTSLVAMIPVLAVALSVATNLIAKDGEEGQEQVEQLIEYFVSTVAPMLDLESKDGSIGEGGEQTDPIDGELAAPSRRTEVARQIHAYINNIQAKTIGVTSVIAFILMAVLLFRSIEATFNDIWGVKKGRDWFTSLVQYWTSLTLGPILLILALGVSSSGHFSRSLEWLRDLPALGAVVLFSVSWLFYSIACSVLYKVMPKTNVHLKSAIMGGVVAGFLLQLNNKLSFLYISNVATADRIYGSLGAAPIFLLGLYVSWIILLFGAQVTYAYQNYKSYMQEKQSDLIHQAGREFLALRLMVLISERFMTSARPPALQDLADRLEVASGLSAEILEILEENELIFEVQGDQGGFVPARPPAGLTVDDVFVALRRGRGKGVVSADDEARLRVRSAVDEIESATTEVARQVSLADLASGKVVLNESVGDVAGVES